MVSSQWYIISLRTLLYEFEYEFDSECVLLSFWMNQTREDE